jgi:iron complex outermembrane receptor protein
LTVQGDGYIGRTTDYEVQPVTLPNFQPRIANMNGYPASFDLQGKWTRSLSDSSQLSLQAFGTHTQRIEDGIDARESTFDVELQHSFALGSRNSILWGVEGRSIGDRILGSPVFYFNPVRRNEFLTAGFISDEIALIPDRLQLSIGTKLEKYSFTSFQPEPSVHLAWTPNDSQTLWASVGRAVRIPSRFELDIRIDAGSIPGPVPTILRVIGNPQAASETLLAYEAGHRIKLGKKVSLDTSLYYNHYGTLRSTQDLTPELVPTPTPWILLPMQYNQLAEGRSMGIENSANFDVRSNWRLTSTYSYGLLSVVPKPGNNSVNNIYQDAPGSLPRHQAQIHSYWDINRKLQLDAGGRYVASLPAQQLPSYTTADVRMGWRVNGSVDVNLAVENIFNDVHSEWVTGDDVLYRGKIFGRTGNAAIVWHF